MSIAPKKQPRITIDGLTYSEMTETAFIKAHPRRVLNHHTLMLVVHKNPQEARPGLVIQVNDCSYKVEFLAYDVDAAGNVLQLIVNFRTLGDDRKLKRK